MLGSVVQVHLSPPLIPVRPISLRSSVFAAVLALAAIGDASAQLRSIPDDAKRAQLRYVREMIVEIDGDRVRLSPGSQIRSVDNRIVLPSSLPQESLLVKYMTDAGGLVHRVWILSQEEAARPDKKK
jgi:hypothetical protein